MDGFNFKKMNYREIKEHCQIKVSERFVALKNMDGDDVDINRA
jgi:hypothetical protein